VVVAPGARLHLFCTLNDNFSGNFAAASAGGEPTGGWVGGVGPAGGRVGGRSVDESQQFPRRL